MKSTPHTHATPDGPGGISPESHATESFLDEVFDRAVEALQRGERPSADALAAARPDLRGAVVELVAAAARLVAREPAVRPPVREVPGYRLIGELGRGGMGVVHRAQQISVADREVALKVLPAGTLGGGEARFTQESRAIGRLKHPSIIAIHDVIASADGPVAIAMELIDGPSLSRLIARLSVGKSAQEPGSQSDRSASGKKSAADLALMGRVRDELGTPPNTAGASPLLDGSYPVFVCRLGSALARALDAVHRAGLVHRDVKPGNVLLRRDGTPVLTDFGLARDLSTAAEATMHTQTGAFIGTAAYAPPEQVRGEHERVDGRSDVYSLGATLFYAFTLRPMPARSTVEALRLFERGYSLPPLRKINPRLARDLETIVATATDPEPARRYQTAGELADDFDRLLELRPIRARAAGPVARAVKAIRRNRKAFFGGAAGAAAAAILGVALMIYIFLMPRWTERHLAAARSALINPRYAELVYAYEARLRDRTFIADQYAGAIDRCGVALREYDAALMMAWGRAVRSQIRLERDTVAVSRTILSGKASGASIPPGLLRPAPGTARIARRWLDAPMHGQIDPAALDGLSPIDLRCMGLLAYLCLDAHGSVDAWSRSGYDMGDPPDPLVHAAAGQAFLAEDLPRRALIRLDRARALLPACKAVTIALADAAVRCDELRLGEQMIEAAGACDQSDDRFEVLLRTRAMLMVKRNRPGDYDRACRLYEQYIARHRAPTGYLQYAQLLLDHRDAFKAMEVYHRLALVRSNPEDPVALGQFVRGIRQCWAALDEPARERLMASDANYAAIWNLYDRTVHSHTPKQLRDPSTSPNEMQTPGAEPSRPRS